MRTAHYISIAAALALTGILYWAVPTTPPPGAVKKPGGARRDEMAANGPMQVAPASTDSLLQAGLKSLPEHARQDLSAMEKRVAALSDSAAMAPLYEEIANLWKEHRQLAPFAWATGKAAHLAHSEKKLNFAGQFYLELMHEAATPSVAAWAAGGAIDCLSEALTLNPANDTTRLALATAYVEGTSAPMSGISILREMVAKNPDHIPANLLLGRLSMQSGQWDKAVTRLEHVVKLEPANREGLYFLAEAYKGKGEKEKAIATFRKLEGIVNSPDFTKDIEKYINSFK